MKIEINTLYNPPLGNNSWMISLPNFPEYQASSYSRQHTKIRSGFFLDLCLSQAHTQ